MSAGSIRFYDNYAPALAVGDYTIAVTQTVDVTDSSLSEPIADQYSGSQGFSVTGPRYALPSSDVYSVFPPDNATGFFGQFLPHVVLAKVDLPWERSEEIFSDATLPWLALLLFEESELLQPSVAGATVNRTVSASIPATQLYDHASGDGVVWPDLTQEWYEADLSSTMCTVIDVAPETFAALMPSEADLRYLAHARSIDASGKADDILRVSGDGLYSVIVAGRLPASSTTGVRNIAHLVSLEGLETYAGGTAFPGGTTRVRMISLQSWTFTCAAATGETFSELMNGLLSEADGAQKSTAMAIQADPLPGSDDATQMVATRLGEGYVPLRYETPLGEATFAWYRGPLTPVPVANFVRAMHDPTAGWQPFGTASSALVYDETNGLFDVSYAVAWETGRLVALADGAFARELAAWQRAGHRAIDSILQRMAQISTLSSIDPTDPGVSTSTDVLLQALQSAPITSEFTAYLARQLAGQLAPALYDEPPVPPDPAFPVYPTAPAPPANPQTIADLLDEPAVHAAVLKLGGIGLDTIADWAAQRYLLVGVPFETLVPHTDLLSPESVRFFYLDSNWLDALLEGALSIGIASSRDQLYQDVMRELIWNTTLDAVQSARNRLVGGAPVAAGITPPIDPTAMSGMLLRSAVVSGWPGLEVHGYSATVSGSYEPDLTTEIPLLRMTRVSSDTLLCLWPSVPAVVTIDEPHEGLAFGFEDPPSAGGAGIWVYLRSVADDATYGTLLNGTEYAFDASTYVDSVTRRVSISASGGLLDEMQATLPGSPTLAVRDFVVELVKVPEQAVFASALVAIEHAFHDHGAVAGAARRLFGALPKALEAIGRHR